MSDSERLYVVLDRIEGKVTANHTEVVQRLARLETNQHSPADCPGVKVIEKKLDKHVEDGEQAKRDAGMKSFVRETVKGGVAAIVGAITALTFKG